MLMPASGSFAIAAIASQAVTTAFALAHDFGAVLCCALGSDMMLLSFEEFKDIMEDYDVSVTIAMVMTHVITLVMTHAITWQCCLKQQEP